MHWRTVIIVIVLVVAYAVIGGVIFHFIETSNENQMHDEATSRLKAFLDEHPCLNLSTVRDISQLLRRAKRGGLQALPGSTNLTYITNWDMASSIFLSFQIVGSVGYGNAPPQTVGGRVFTVCFAFLGIPLMWTASLGIGYMMINGAERLRKCCIRHAGPKDAAKVHVVRTLTIFIVIFILFVLIPAAIFTALDRTWSYGDALYFCLITVLTVGFGDFVPGSDWTTEARNAFRLSVGFWLILSLLIFAGLWNSVIIAIFSTKEMLEPLTADQEMPVLNRGPSFTKKQLPDNAIQYIPQQTPADYEVFARGSSPPVAYNSNPYDVKRSTQLYSGYNSNPYVMNRSTPLYSVSVPQGNVTQVSVR